MFAAWGNRSVSTCELCPLAGKLIVVAASVAPVESRNVAGTVAACPEQFTCHQAARVIECQRVGVGATRL
jgi:hypothetical protein